jgi:two-component system, cell cycle response regulator
VSDWEEETGIADPADPAALAPDERERAYLIVLAGHSVGEMFKLPTAPAVIGRGPRCEVPVHDEGVSRAHARIVPADDEVWVEDLGSRNGTYINGARVRGRARLADGDKIQVGRTTILKFTYHDSLEESFQKQMYESALRDGLTRIYNKRYFTERIASELRFAIRHRAQLALLMLDLDDLKRINDEHGHLAGDRALVAVAQALARSIRHEDVVARYGGDELAVLLRATPIEHARGTAERLRRTVEALAIEGGGGAALRVTVSIGLASYPEAAIQTPQELIEIADQALYRAKRAGRNRVDG